MGKVWKYSKFEASLRESSEFLNSPGRVRPCLDRGWAGRGTYIFTLTACLPTASIEGPLAFPSNRQHPVGPVAIPHSQPTAL